MKRILLVALCCAICSTTMARAQDGEAQGPPGPPDEIKEMAFLVGTWDVKSMMRMDPTADFVPLVGVAEYAYIAGGACLQMIYTSSMNGMPFNGVAHTTFNRETGEWMDTWTDDMAGSMSVYTGKKKDGKLVVNGEDHYEGMSVLTRITTTFGTETSFKWQMEHSYDGGDSWAVQMVSDYSKR